MSQADIESFVNSAWYGTLTPEGVTTAVVRGIPVHGRNSKWGLTALHYAVLRRRELVVALVAAGADANVKTDSGQTSVRWGASVGTADILQLLIDAGGGVNEPEIDGETPLIALVRNNRGDAAARLQLLLVYPDLDLDVKYRGRTAEEWAVSNGHPELAVAIAEKRRNRVRWTTVRCAWVAATARPPAERTCTSS